MLTVVANALRLRRVELYSNSADPSHFANATPTIFLGSVTFRDGKVIEFTNSFAAR